VLFISWRQLLSRKQQTLLIIVGITLGSALYVLISGIQLGSREYIFEQLLKDSSHINISGQDQRVDSHFVEHIINPDAKKLINWIAYPYGKKKESELEGPNQWYKILEVEKDVIAYSPRIVSNALIRYRSIDSNISVIGVNPSQQTKVTEVASYMKEGKFLDLQGAMGSIIIGHRLAYDLGVQVGQYVHLSHGETIDKPFRVVGIIEYGNKRLDETIAFTNLADAQLINGTPGRISEIGVKLHDPDLSEVVSKRWNKFSDDQIIDWKEENEGFMEIIVIQDISRYIITFSILIVAAFGVYNILSIMINQKKREIAILRSIGYTPRDILYIFLYQGGILGGLGGLAGVIMGLLLCLYVGSVELDINTGGRGMDMKFLTMSYDISIYITAFCSAFFASLLASYLPARKASLMTPIDIIRSE
jgi:lipoprotein-releasing system permease protein